jgi:hypothetical protein
LAEQIELEAKKVFAFEQELNKFINEFNDKHQHEDLAIMVKPKQVEKLDDEPRHEVVVITFSQNEENDLFQSSLEALRTQ